METKETMPVSRENNAIYANVDYQIRLPEAEFEVMTAVWKGEAPMTTHYLMEAIGNAKGWKAPTLISFLVRLEKRGYIVSEKKGKERFYTPVADRDAYLKVVTERFVNKYHDGSFVKVLDALFRDRKFSTAEVDALMEWLQAKYR